MNLFRKKQTSEEENGQQDEAEQPIVKADPVKAQVFFDRAQTVHDTTNYAYAMTLWLQGMRKDPTSVFALEKYVHSAASYVDANPKAKGPTKDQVGAITGQGSDLEKYLHALLQWGARGFDWEWGLKAMEHAVKLELWEPGYFVGERVLNAAQQSQKTKKSSYVRMFETFEKLGAFDKAVRAGEIAYNLDPRDNKLEQRLKNMSAQATMTSGGYEDTGDEGGYRRNVRNIEQQKRLEEEESIVKSQDTLDKLIKEHAGEVKRNPDDRVAVDKYVKFLLERGTAQDEKIAYNTLTETYKRSGSYQYKKQADEVKLRVGRRKLQRLEREAQADPDDEEKAEEAQKFRQGLLNEEIKIFQERVQNYPTDLRLKYDLGRRLLQAERYEEAIQQFQVAQNAPGLGGRVREMLGQSFYALGWFDEAEQTYRQAIESHASETDDLGMDLRYGLLKVLQERAERDQDLGAAEEAFKIASSIAIQQINFRDIRERRGKLEEMRKELKASA